MFPIDKSFHVPFLFFFLFFLIWGFSIKGCPSVFLVTQLSDRYLNY